MANEISSGTIGNTAMATGTTITVGTWITSNATILSLSLTLLSFIVGGVFLYLNRKDKQAHDKIMEDIALRELQLKEQAALNGSLKD